MLIFAKESGTAITFVPVLYLVFTATASVTSYPFGKLADKIGRKWVVITAFVLFGFMCGWFILRMYVPFLFIVYGLDKGALDPVQKTVVAELAPASRKASILGAYQMLLGACALLSSVVAGVLWDTFGMTMPFVFSFTTSVGASLLMLFVREQ